MRGRIHWYYDTLTPRTAAYVAGFELGLGIVLEEYAEEIQEYAQENAPWEDQTGDARGGLTAQYVDAGFMEHAIVLYHTVDYGIWLETRWNGRLAIILPTLEAMGPRIMGGLGQIHSEMP